MSGMNEGVEMKLGSCGMSGFAASMPRHNYHIMG